MSAFNEGLMTGASLGQGAYRQRQAREVGGLMSGGNYAGAAAAAYGQGDLATGQGIERIGQQQAETQRQGQITDALQSGDYATATGFASTPEELAAITEFRSSATEQQRAEVVRNATNLASIIESIQSLPPAEQLAAAQRVAPQFGVDPSRITQETLGQLDALRIQAMGLKEYLEYKQDQVNATRPIIGNGFISLPPGSQVPGQAPQPEYVDELPPGVRPRPNQAPSAPAAGGAERNQPVSVNFRSSSEAQSAIQRNVPGVTVTSGRRTPQQNQRAGGVPTSFHLQDRARDLVPPRGMSMAQLAQKMRQAGFRVLDEGDHVHVSW